MLLKILENFNVVVKAGIKLSLSCLLFLCLIIGTKKWFSYEQGKNIEKNKQAREFAEKYEFKGELKDCKLIIQPRVDYPDRQSIPELYIVRCPQSTTTNWVETGKYPLYRGITMVN